MGNNDEIRQRMETCRKVLLAVVWIAGIAGIIGGLKMIMNQDSWGTNYLRLLGIAELIVSILGSIIGHFLVNVFLAIPFILLNNGDILESMKKNHVTQGNTSEKIVSNSNTNSGSSYPQTKNNTSNEETYVPSFLRLQQDEKPATFVANITYKKCTKEVDEDIAKCPHCGNKTFV